jgi:hypothetical protein
MARVIIRCSLDTKAKVARANVDRILRDFSKIEMLELRPIGTAMWEGVMPPAVAGHVVHRMLESIGDGGELDHFYLHVDGSVELANEQADQ